MSEFFPEVPQKIAYGGPKSRNPLEFKHYDAAEEVGGRTMSEHLRFSVVYWHTFANPLADPFGGGTAIRPWDDGTPSVANYLKRVDAAFEFITKLGAPYYAFHDRDVAPEGKDWKETSANFEAIARKLKEKQDETGVKLLWGTANLFSNRRYMHGAGTSPSVEAFAFAGAQVKHAMDVTHRLGGEGYTFWGGREGYFTLLNTNMKRELDHLARLLHLAVEHKKAIGFTGQFYIEPKPKEPTKHQYDSDAAACLNFLRQYDLLPHFQLNIETNHATLAGHDVQHELRVAADSGALGSIDANTGDPLLGWDTDQFPTSIYLTAFCMLEVLAMGGFTTGGVNFDAKVRRESFEPIDLFHAHVGGMDAFARGLKIAHAIREDGRLAEFVKARYASWDTPLGQKIEQGKVSLAELEAHALKAGEAPAAVSGRQEMLENLLNEFI